MQINQIIQTRSDLDRVIDTPVGKKFIQLLKGSMVKKICVTTFPEDYNYDLKEGDEGFIALEFEEIEDLSTIEQFGFTKAEILNL